MDRIPFSGNACRDAVALEKLNVATAGGTVIYELLRKYRGRGPAIR